MSQRNRTIICIKSYEIDGVKVEEGHRGHQPFGRPIMQPDLWRELTEEELHDEIIQKGCPSCGFAGIGMYLNEEEDTYYLQCFQCRYDEKIKH